ncbi:MAG: hypothetical protein ABI599_03155 [Flavobacteriales bacterium]
MHTEEYAYWEPTGALTIASTSVETARDGNDTMAYLIDTLLYEKQLQGTMVLPDNGGGPVKVYELVRRPLDLTKHWLTKFPTDQTALEQRYALRTALPPGKHPFRTAIGDLDGDGINDYAFALEPDTGFGESDGVRDLQIVFTTPGGFQQQLLLPGFFPGRSAGGFHDPLGEDVSGISISGDTLIVALFGGSAWKWQSRQDYRYSVERRAFYLIKEQSRSYHAPSVDSMHDDLASLEQLVARGATLVPEQEERLQLLRKMVAGYVWATKVYEMGERRIGE